jgi:hypothetical protein
MPVKDNQKNKEYVAKHRTTARATLGDAEYRKKEAEARALRRQKEKARKAQEAITLPPLKLSGANELFDLPKLQPLDINNMINLLPPLPKPQPEKKKRGRKPKPHEEITDTMTYKEKRKIYMRNYMKEYKKLQKK